MTDQKQLYNYQLKDDSLNKIIQFLLRTQMGIFDNLVPINENKIAKHTSVPVSVVAKQLQWLAKNEVVEYFPTSNSSTITFITERLADNNLSLPAHLYHQRQKVAENKLEGMINYLTSVDCTEKLVLQYFGEKDAADCKKCNRCIVQNGKIKSSDIKRSTTSYLNKRFNNNQEVAVKDLLADLSMVPRRNVLQVIREMADQNHLHIDRLGQKLRKP